MHMLRSIPSVSLQLLRASSRLGWIISAAPRPAAVADKLRLAQGYERRFLSTSAVLASKSNPNASRRSLVPGESTGAGEKPGLAQSSGMMVACQCGSVSFTVPTSAPLAVYHCHCTECQKQSSSAFGTSAVFPAADIFPLSADLREKLTLYVRPGDRVASRREMDCYFCKTCGSRVMHRIRNEDGSERSTVSIKGGLVDGLDWSKARHIYTESAVVELPEGVESHPRAPPVYPGTSLSKDTRR